MSNMGRLESTGKKDLNQKRKEQLFQERSRRERSCPTVANKIDAYRRSGEDRQRGEREGANFGDGMQKREER